MSSFPILQWSPSEAATVNEFLNSGVGKKWLGILLTRKPQVDVTKGMEVAGLSGAYAAGYERFFVEIAATRATITGDSYSAKSIDPTKD